MALGAFSHAVIGCFDWRKKKYQPIPIDAQVEVITLVGGIAENGKREGAQAVSLSRRFAAVRNAAKYEHPTRTFEPFGGAAPRAEGGFARARPAACQDSRRHCYIAARNPDRVGNKDYWGNESFGTKLQRAAVMSMRRFYHAGR